MATKLIFLCSPQMSSFVKGANMKLNRTADIFSFISRATSTDTRNSCWKMFYRFAWYIVRKKSPTREIVSPFDVICHSPLDRLPLPWVRCEKLSLWDRNSHWKISGSHIRLIFCSGIETNYETHDLVTNNFCAHITANEK